MALAYIMYLPFIIIRMCILFEVELVATLYPQRCNGQIAFNMFIKTVSINNDVLTAVVHVCVCGSDMTL